MIWHKGIGNKGIIKTISGAGSRHLDSGTLASRVISGTYLGVAGPGRTWSDVIKSGRTRPDLVEVARLGRLRWTYSNMTEHGHRPKAAKFRRTLSDVAESGRALADAAGRCRTLLR